jgi:hypothetical protein
LGGIEKADLVVRSGWLLCLFSKQFLSSGLIIDNYSGLDPCVITGS